MFVDVRDGTRDVIGIMWADGEGKPFWMRQMAINRVTIS